MSTAKRTKVEPEEEAVDDVDRLIDWAETDTEPGRRIGESEDVCESDLVDDRVGLPEGTTGRLEEHLLNDEEMEETEVSETIAKQGA